MKIKRIFSFLLMLVLLLSCLPATAITANAAAKVDLTVWADAPTLDWVLQRAKDFNAKSSKWKLNITVSDCHVGDSGNIVSADPEAAADIYMYSNDNMGILIDAGALLPITGDALKQVKADNSDTIIDTVTYSDGKIYGIPFTGNTYFMYYNKKVFSESDVKSLETMLKKGRVAIPLDNTWYLPAFYYAGGCTMFGSSGADAQYGIDFFSQKGIAVTKYLNKLVNNKNLKWGSYCSAASLIDGKVDAFFSGTWEANTMKEAFGNKYGATQLPTVTIDGKTCQLLAFSGSKAYGVNAHTKHPEAAMAFAAFLGNTTSQKQRYSLINDIPVSPSLASDKLLKADPAAVAQMKTLANTSVLQPWIPEMGNFWNFMPQLSEAILNGELNDDNIYDRMAEIGCQMNNGLVILEQPQSVTVNSGTAATVSVVARGEDISYQWYVKNNGESKYTKSDVTSDTYTVDMSADTADQKVYCVIKNGSGSSLRTTTATLKMTKQKLKITKQPKTSYTQYGETATATIKATGNGLKYRWYVKKSGASKYTKTSNTTDTYTVKMTDSVKNQYVYCVVTDQYGKTAKSDVVRLRMAATITSQPTESFTKYGSTAKITIKAKGDGLKYQWYTKSATGSKFSKASGTSATYSAKMSSSSKDRYVYCVVKDKYGKSVKSEVIQLQLAATITTQPKTAYAQLGQTASTTVKAKGDGLTYSWYYKNAGDSAYTKSSVTTKTYAVEINNETKDQKVYCVVTDQYGKTVKSSTVRMRLAATITQQPESVTVSKGRTAKVTVEAEGDGLTYTWYLKKPGKSKYSKTSVTKAYYSAKMSKTVSGSRVYCVVKDKYGNTVKSSTATLKMSK